LLEEHLDGTDAVTPADLLTLRPATRLETYRQFHDLMASA
jgi:hypothetical protein